MQRPENVHSGNERELYEHKISNRLIKEQIIL